MKSSEFGTISLFSTISNGGVRRSNINLFKQLSMKKETNKTDLHNYYTSNGNSSLLSSDVSVIVSNSKSTKIDSCKFKETLKQYLVNSNQRRSRLRRELREIKPNVVLKRKGFETKELPLNENYLELSVKESQCPMVVRIHKGYPGNESHNYTANEDISDFAEFESQLPYISGNHYVNINENVDVERYEKTVHKKRKKRKTTVPSSEACYIPHYDKNDWSQPSKLRSSSKDTYNRELGLLKGSFISSLKSYKNKIISAAKIDSMSDNFREPKKKITTSFIVRALSSTEDPVEQIAQEHKRSKNHNKSPTRNIKARERINNKKSLQDKTNNYDPNGSINTDNNVFVSGTKKITKPHRSKPEYESQDFELLNQYSSETSLNSVQNYKEDNRYRDSSPRSFAVIASSSILANEKQRKTHKNYDETDFKSLKNSLKKSQDQVNNDMVILNASQNEFSKISDFLKRKDIIDKLRVPSILLISKFPTKEETSGSLSARKPSFSQSSKDFKSFTSKKTTDQKYAAQAMSSIQSPNVLLKKKRREDEAEAERKQKSKTSALNQVYINVAQDVNDYYPRIASTNSQRKRIIIDGSVFNKSNESIRNAKKSSNTERVNNKFDDDQSTNDLFEYDLIPQQDRPIKVLNKSKQYLRYNVSFDKEDIEDKVSERHNDLKNSEIFIDDLNEKINVEDTKPFPTTDSNIILSANNLFSNEVSYSVTSEYHSKPLVQNSVNRQNTSNSSTLTEHSLSGGVSSQSHYVSENIDKNTSNYLIRDLNIPNEETYKTKATYPDMTATNIENKTLYLNPTTARIPANIVTKNYFKSQDITPNSYAQLIDSTNVKSSNSDSKSKDTESHPQASAYNHKKLHVLNSDSKFQKALPFEDTNKIQYFSENPNENLIYNKKSRRINANLGDILKNKPYLQAEKNKNSFLNVETSVSSVRFESVNYSRTKSPSSARPVSVEVQTEGKCKIIKTYNSIGKLNDILNVVDKNESTTRMRGTQIISAILSEPSQFLETKPIISDPSQFHVSEQNKQKDLFSSPKTVIENKTSHLRDKELIQNDEMPKSSKEKGLYLKSFQRLDIPAQKTYNFKTTRHEMVTKGVQIPSITSHTFNEKQVLERFSNKGTQVIVTESNRSNPTSLTQNHILNKGQQHMAVPKQFSTKETQVEPGGPNSGHTPLQNRELNEGFEKLIIAKQFSNKEPQFISVVEPDWDNSAHTIQSQNKVPKDEVKSSMITKQFSNKEPQFISLVEPDWDNSAHTIQSQNKVPKDRVKSSMITKQFSNKEPQFIGVEPNKKSNSYETKIQTRGPHGKFENLVMAKQFSNKETQFINEEFDWSSIAQKPIEQNQTTNDRLNNAMIAKQFSNKETQFIGVEPNKSGSSETLMKKRNLNSRFNNLVESKQFSNKGTQFISDEFDWSSSAQTLPTQNGIPDDRLKKDQRHYNTAHSILQVTDREKQNVPNFRNRYKSELDHQSETGSIQNQKTRSPNLVQNSSTDQINDESTGQNYVSSGKEDFVGSHSTSFSSQAQRSESSFDPPHRPFFKSKNIFMTELPSETTLSSMEPTSSKELLTNKLGSLKSCNDPSYHTESPKHFSFNSENHQSERAVELKNMEPPWNDNSQQSQTDSFKSAGLSLNKPQSFTNDVTKTPQSSQKSNEVINKPVWNNIEDIVEPKTLYEENKSSRVCSNKSDLSKTDSSTIENKKYISKENRSMADSQTLYFPFKTESKQTLDKSPARLTESNISNPAFTCNINNTNDNNDQSYHSEGFRSLSSGVLSFSHILFNITVKDSENVSLSSDFSHSKPLETSLLLLPVECSQSVPTRNLEDENHNLGKAKNTLGSSDKVKSDIEKEHLNRGTTSSKENNTSHNKSSSKQSVLQNIKNSLLKLTKESSHSESTLNLSYKNKLGSKSKKQAEDSRQEINSSFTTSDDTKNEDLTKTSTSNHTVKNTNKWKKLLKHKKGFKKINNLFMSGYVMVRLLGGLKAKDGKKTSKKYRFNKGQMNDYSLSWRHSNLETNCSGDISTTLCSKFVNRYKNNLNGYESFPRKFWFSKPNTNSKSKSFTDLRHKNPFCPIRITPICKINRTKCGYTFHDRIGLPQVKKVQSCYNVTYKNNILPYKTYSFSEDNFKLKPYF